MNCRDTLVGCDMMWPFQKCFESIFIYIYMYIYMCNIYVYSTYVCDGRVPGHLFGKKNGVNMPNLMTKSSSKSSTSHKDDAQVIHCWAEVPDDWATNLCATSTTALRAFLQEPHETKENKSPYNQSTDISKLSISIINSRFVLCSQGLPFNVFLETFMKGGAHDSVILILNKKPLELRAAMVIVEFNWASAVLWLLTIFKYPCGNLAKDGMVRAMTGAGIVTVRSPETRGQLLD